MNNRTSNIETNGMRIRTGHVDAQMMRNVKLTITSDLITMSNDIGMFTIIIESTCDISRAINSNSCNINNSKHNSAIK